MTLKIIHPDRDDVKALIRQADELMRASYPAESNHLDGIRALSQSNVCFVGKFIHDELAGIGAVKIMRDDGQYGEIKRVFVDPGHRGRQLAMAIMRFLEQYLLDSDIELARLETGNRQHAAIALYQKLGYRTRAPFGTYRDDPLSVFMEKRLSFKTHPAR